MLTKIVDGHTVEATYSSPGVAPGETGQHQSHNVVWYRIDGGAWKLADERTMHKFILRLYTMGLMAL